MKINKLNLVLPLGVIILSFLTAFYYYPIFPETIATHWGISGQADGFASKAFGLFFMPFLSLLLFLMFLVLPKTDPYRKNFEQFKSYFENFISIIMVFLFYLYLLTIYWNLGSRFNMIQALSPAFAALFFYTGILTSKAKRNWFVGIRTPWTLSSDKVWEKTHTLGGKLFKLVSFTCLLGVILPQYALFLFLVPTISVTLVLFVYSYILYKNST